MAIHFIVPYYAEPRYLYELIESVRAQSRGDWRLTVVDDDYPGTAAAEYISGLDDPRVEYVRNDCNLGTNRNVSKCMTLGRLEYITVLGADDALLPNYVEVVLASFERHPDAVMVHPGVVVVDEDGLSTQQLVDRVKRLMGRRAWRAGEIHGRQAVRSLMMGNWLYIPAVCIRTDAVGRARNLGAFGCIDDLAWVVDILTEGGTLVLDGSPAFRYRRHSNSHSSVGARGTLRFEEEQTYYAAVAAQLDARGWHDAARVARIHPLTRMHALKASASALLVGEASLARALARRAIRSC